MAVHLSKITYTEDLGALKTPNNLLMAKCIYRDMKMTNILHPRFYFTAIFSVEKKRIYFSNQYKKNAAGIMYRPLKHHSAP